MCEDLGAEPMLVVNCGMACQYRNGDHIPIDELDEWIEDALAAIEYAIDSDQQAGRTLEGVAPSFCYTFPPHSLTVMVLKER